MNQLALAEEKLAPHGILPRGVISFDEGEGPALKSGGTAQTLLLLGNAGGSIWEPFKQWRMQQADNGGDNPLDLWSELVIRPVAEALDARAYFPNEKPWWPFQQWAKRAEALSPSPLGPLIHPKLGLWHGYRGALGFAERFEVEPAALPASPCESCIEKPCLSTCPAEAISAQGFDVPRCRSYLKTVVGEAHSCLSGGCIARNACPVGAEYRYPVEQLQFHMAALTL